MPEKSEIYSCLSGPNGRVETVLEYRWVLPLGVRCRMMARVHPLQWLRRHDRDFAALRRAGRAAIVMPALFALGDKVIRNADVATFAAFGSFAMLLLVDFGGPMRDRLRGQAALAVTGGVLVCLGTLASQNVWLAGAAMAVIGFVVIFAGVVSSVLAGATTSLLLAFILPVSLTGPVSSIPDRLAGWALAAVASFVAVALLWPAPAREPLRMAAVTASRALAARLRAEIASSAEDLDRAIERSNQAVGGLRQVFLATPYRPTGLSTANRAIIRLVDELGWLNDIIQQSGRHRAGLTVEPSVCDVKLAAAAVLEHAAALLELTGDADDLHAAMAELSSALARMERISTDELPVHREQVNEFITSLDPSFRAQELSFAVSLVAGNVDLAAAADRRSWPDRLLGRQPQGLAGSLSGTLSAAQERATAHVERHSVWLHNSVRGAAGLGLAVVVANLTGVQHSFWVVLGTLSVLRSNALNTGQNAIRGLLGTIAGFVIGAGLLALIGTNETRLWALLPVAILIAGVAPAAISFAAGQAAFTLTLVILFNIIQPAGWRIGLLRVEDIAIGCAVSLLVGLLFWPRGARAALRRALAEAYSDSSAYLAGAVDFGMSRCDPRKVSPAAPTGDAVRAAAASRRLDDAFRGYLAERGAKPLPLAQVTSLVTGVAGIRLAADAVMDLWQRDDGTADGDRAAARHELLTATELVRHWYDDLAGSLTGARQLPQPLAHDKVADGRLIQAVRQDLRGTDGRASATAVRMIWTGDHVDAVRRLQSAVFDPARAAASAQIRGRERAGRPD
jgi:uncharacterized membrane protein YccC